MAQLPGPQFLLGFELPLEGWLAPGAAKLGDIPLGRMSFFTALAAAGPDTWLFTFLRPGVVLPSASHFSQFLSAAGPGHPDPDHRRHGILLLSRPPVGGVTPEAQEELAAIAKLEVDH